MTGVLLSFLATISIPLIILLAIQVIRKIWLRQSWKFDRGFFLNAALAVVITVAITCVICLVFRWTGFLDAMFFRPSQRDYARQEALDTLPEDLFFQSSDGTTLHGWLIPAKSDRKGTVIHCHGSDRNISFTVQNSAWLAEFGFDVFVFDYRGYGKSEGRPSTTGVIEDTVAAAEFIHTKQATQAKVILWGQSMGGQLAIIAASRLGPDKVAAVVSESTYASRSHQIKDKVAQLGPLWIMQWGVWLFTSDQHAAIHVVDQLESIPLLLIHSASDTAVQEYHSHWLHERANLPKEYWALGKPAHLAVFHDALMRSKLAENLIETLPPQAASAAGKPVAVEGRD